MASLIRKWLLLIELGIRCIIPPFYSFAMLEKVCKKKLDKRPNDLGVLWVLSNFYISYEKYADAQIHLETLMKLGIDTKPVRLLLARAYFLQGQYNKTEQLLNKPKILSDKDIANYYLGYSLMELGNLNDAIKYLNKCVNHHPKEYKPFVCLGYAYYKQGRYDFALDAYRRAYKLNPSGEIKNDIDICIENL